MHLFGSGAVLAISITMLATTTVALEAPKVGQAALPQGVPANYRQIIVQEMKTALTTNSHIRDAVISEPRVYTGFQAFPFGRIVGYCVTFHATGVFGETADVRIYSFSDGKLVSGGSIRGMASQGLFCDRSMVFTRFPELDGVR